MYKKSLTIIRGVDKTCTLVCISESTGKLYRNDSVEELDGLRCHSHTNDRCFNGSCVVSELCNYLRYLIDWFSRSAATTFQCLEKNMIIVASATATAHRAFKIIAPSHLEYSKPQTVK